MILDQTVFVYLDSQEVNSYSKMGYFVALALFLAVANAGILSIDKDALEKELQDFRRLYPMEDIANLIEAYHDEDPEFKHLVKYVQSPEFDEVFTALLKAPETIAVLEYLDESGLKIYDYVQHMKNAFYLKHLNAESKDIQSLAITGGLKGLVADLRPLVPRKEVRDLHAKKMKSSPVYTAFVNRIASREFEHLRYNVRNSKPFLNMLVSAIKAGIDVVSIRQYFCVLAALDKC